MCPHGRSALPCTERLVNTEAAGRLANAGIVGLMAHKGRPELRLASLDSVAGPPLVFAGVASKPSACPSTMQGATATANNSGHHARLPAQHWMQGTA